MLCEGSVVAAPRAQRVPVPLRQQRKIAVTSELGAWPGHAAARLLALKLTAQRISKQVHPRVTPHPICEDQQSPVSREDVVMEVLVLLA